MALRSLPLLKVAFSTKTVPVVTLSRLIGLTLEGYMLGGAFAAAVGSYYGHSAWLGVFAGVGGGAALALLYGVRS